MVPAPTCDDLARDAAAEYGSSNSFGIFPIRDAWIRRAEHYRIASEEAMKRENQLLDDLATVNVEVESYEAMKEGAAIRIADLETALAAAQQREAGLRVACNKAIGIIHGLADQQAMPDDSYKRPLAEVEAALAASEPPPTPDESFPQSVDIGPNGKPKCPKCGNSSQNVSPADRPDLLRCATCKTVFHPCAITFAEASEPPQGEPAPAEPWEVELSGLVESWRDDAAARRECQELRPADVYDECADEIEALLARRLGGETKTSA